MNSFSIKNCEATDDYYLIPENGVKIKNIIFPDDASLHCLWVYEKNLDSLIGCPKNLQSVCISRNNVKTVYGISKFLNIGTDLDRNMLTSLDFLPLFVGSSSSSGYRDIEI